MKAGERPFPIVASLSRREVTKAGALLGSSALLAGPVGFSAPSPSRALDWPGWALTRANLLSKIDTLSRSAVDVRSFGARLDGIADDSSALERALASGARAITIPGGTGATLRLTRQIMLDRAVAILGSGGEARIVCDGQFGAAFLAMPPSGAAGDFVHDISFDSILAERDPARETGGALIMAFSVRGLYLTRCRSQRMSLAVVRHMRQRLNLYSRQKGSKTVDPAVVAGFSSTATDDLNEDIYVCDCQVNYGKYQGAVLRFEFARKVVVSGNLGNHAKISWWGGGAHISEGGALEFLRRVRDVYIADNVLTGANGGVYGNNGQNVIVARNRVSDMTDVGVDFEGCMDCVAYDNDVRNIGNFCYVTFYAARNIEFRGNYGEQDGTAGDLPRRFGAGKIGSPRGVYLAALRSANFAQVPGAVTVNFTGNTFSYRGQGFGKCLPSYFERLAFTNNKLTDVLCDWRYRLTRSLEIRGNTLRFTKPLTQDTTLLAGGAASGVLVANHLELEASSRELRGFVGYSILTHKIALEISGMHVSGRGAEGVTLSVDAARGVRGRIALRNNSVARAALDPALAADDLVLAGNSTPSGMPLSPFRQDRPLPGYP